MYIWLYRLDTVEMCTCHCVREAKWQRVLVACEDLGAFKWVHGLKLGGLWDGLCKGGVAKAVYLENTGKVSKGTYCL
jgi:hypothetical protein